MTLTHLRTSPFCLLLLFLSGALVASQTLGVTSDESRIAKTGVTYTFTISSGTTTMKFSATNSKIELTFPSGYAFGTTSCSTSTGSASISCTRSSLVVTLTNIENQFSSSDTRFPFRISGVTNPSTTGTTGTFTARIYNGTDLKLTQQGTFSISVGTARSCSITPSSLVRGDLTTVTFQIQPENTIPGNGGLEISLPQWTSQGDSMIPPAPRTDSCQVSSPSTNANPGCTALRDSNIIRVTSLLSSSSSSISNTQTLTVSFSSIYNPPVATPYTFTLTTLDASGLSIDQCTATLTATVANSITVPSTGFISCFDNSDSKIINAVERCLLTFTTTNYLSSNAIITVTFPTEVGFDSLTSVEEYAPFTPSNMLSNINTNTKVVTLTNSLTTFAQRSTTFQFLFVRIRHPGTTKASSNFNITTSYVAGGPFIDVLKTDVTYSASAGVIPSVTVSASPSTAGSTSAITLSFQITNGLTANSQVKVTFPTSYTLPSTATTPCSGLPSSSATCAVSSADRSITVSGYTASSLSAGATITVTIQGIVLPGSRIPTTLAVRTLDNGFEVDKNDAASFTATAGEIVSKSLFVETGAVTGGISSYKITFTNVNAIPAFGRFQIQLPSDNSVVISDLSKVQNQMEFKIDTGNAQTISSTVNSAGTSSIITFTNPTNAQIDIGKSIQIAIPSLRNPLDTGATESFAITTMTADPYTIDQTTTGLAFSSGSINASDFYSASVTNTPTRTGTTAVYQFSITPAIAHTSANYLVVTFPLTYKFASPTCTFSSPVSRTVICTRNDVTNTISMPLGLDLAAQQELVLNINNVKNPIGADTYTGFGLLTRTSSSVTAPNVHNRTSLFVPVTPSSITNANLVRSTKNLGASATFTLSFIRINSYPANSVIEVYIPPELTIPSSVSCRSATGLYSNLSCTLDSTARTITTVGGFPTTTSTNVSFVIDSLQNQATQIDSTTFKISVKSDGLIIDQLDTELLALAPCNPICLTCKEDNRDYCLTCNSAGLYPLLNKVSNQCVSSCPTSRTYQSGTECLACDPSCLTCSGGLNTNCQSCDTSSTSFPSFDSTTSMCLNQCNDGYYAATNTKVCTPCVGNCKTCSSNVDCNSCNAGTYLLNKRCNSNCDDGYYKYDPLLTCRTCKNTCLTCDNGISCSSCSSSGSFPIFHDNNCLQTCPSGYSNNGGTTCSACNAPCVTCSTTSDTCLTCTPGLYPYQGGCQTCQAPCASCVDSPFTCASCESGLLLQGTSCVSSCSDGYYLDSGSSTCRKCSTGCLTCSSATSCSVCDVSSSTPLLAGGSCVATCPSNLSDEQNGVCVAAKTIPNPYDGIYLSGLPFPFVIFGIIFSVLVGIGRMVSEQTIVISNIIGFLSLLEFSAWMALLILLLMSHPGEAISNFPGLPFILIAIITAIALNVVFYLRVLRHQIKADSFISYKKEHKSHRRYSLLIQSLSIVSFKCFRLIYSKFFGLRMASYEIAEPKVFQLSLNKYTGVNFFISVLPALLASIITLSKDGGTLPQLRDISIEVILLSLAIMILTILDALRISELEKKGNILPDATNFTVLNAQALSMLEKSIIDKLNESMDTTNQQFRRPKSKLGAYRRRNSLDSSYEYNDGNSSFINLNNTVEKKLGSGNNKDDSFNETQHGQVSRVNAIEEIENDDDDQPTLNMKNKTLGQLRNMLKDQGHQLQPDKILIENKDGSIIVLRDKTSYLDNNLNMIKGSPSKSQISTIRGPEEEGGRTQLSKFINDEEGISLTARGRRMRNQEGNGDNDDKENGGYQASIHNTNKKKGDGEFEESEEELELHDSYGNLEAKMSRNKVHGTIYSSNHLDGDDFDTIGSARVRKNNLIDPIKIQESPILKTIDNNPDNSRSFFDGKSQMNSPLPNAVDEDHDAIENYMPQTDSKNALPGESRLGGSPGNFLGKPPTGRHNKSPIGKNESTKKERKPKKEGGEEAPGGVEYISSDSQASAEDLHERFQDDTPSNYDVLNQRFDEELYSPMQNKNGRGRQPGMSPYGGMSQNSRNGVRPLLPPVNEVTEPHKKSYSTSPHRIAYMHNFMNEEDIGSVIRKREGEEYGKNAFSRTASKMESVNGGNQSLGGTRTNLSEGKKRAMTPQTRQNFGRRRQESVERQLSSRGNIQVGSIGSLNKTARSFNRGMSGQEEAKTSSQGLDSQRSSVDKMKRLESIYLNKVKIPRLNKDTSKNIKHALANSRGFLEDDLTNNDGLEIEDFTKFESLVNGMKKNDESINKFETDTIEKENL